MSPPTWLAPPIVVGSSGLDLYRDDSKGSIQGRFVFIRPPSDGPMIWNVSYEKSDQRFAHLHFSWESWSGRSALIVRDDKDAALGVYRISVSISEPKALPHGRSSSGVALSIHVL
jgi:hypothetical protein